MFANNEHLDLTPFDDGEVKDVHFSFAKPLPRPVNVKQQAERLELEAGLRRWALAHSRRCREAELAVPVTHVEVLFSDVWRTKRFWNLDFDALKAMAASRHYAHLRAVARVRGFSTHMDGRFFHNSYGELRVQLKLTFVRLNPERVAGYPAKGRTYTRSVTP